MMAILNILITGIATPFVNGFVTFAILRFLMGLSYPTFLMSTYMLSEFKTNVTKAKSAKQCFAGLPEGTKSWRGYCT